MRKIALRRGMMVALAIIAGIFLLSPGLTFAGVQGGAGPTVQTHSVKVGQTGLDWTFDITNTSKGDNASHPIRVTNILLTTACGVGSPDPNGHCPDPEAINTIEVSPTTGRKGTLACADVTFTFFATANPNEYQISFDKDVILAPADPGGPNITCSIPLKVNINKGVKDTTPPRTTFPIGFAALHDDTAVLDGFASGSDFLEVSLCNPKIVTTPTPSFSSIVPVTLNDSATLTGDVGCPNVIPKGNIAFNLYGVNDSSCSKAPIFTQTVTVDGVGTYSTSPGYTAGAGGTYQWIATYTGDVSNNSATGKCGDEPVVIKTPKITTTPNPSSGPVGTVLNDSATLSDGVDPTGSITFKLFGPNDFTCSGDPIFTNTVPVSGNGTYSTTAGFPATAAGTYYWVATYSGDSNNSSVSDRCGNESVVITIIRISTKPIPSSGRLGNVPPLKDSATLADGVNPTGTITFKLFDLSDPNCGGQPIFTNTVNVNGNGTYNTSDGYTGVVEEGTYHWTATYSGDAKNNSVWSKCEDEPVVITKRPPGGAGERPYIAIVGNDIAFNPFYFSEKHQQFFLDQEAMDVPVCFGAFPPVTQQTWLGGLGCEQFRSNKPINQPEICDVGGQIIDFAKGYFIFFGEPNAVITKQNAGYFEWFIRLPKKPNGEINICIQCGVLKPNTFTPFTGFWAVEECAAETGERIGRGWCTQNQVEPPANPIINSALPRITAIVYPGPQAPVDFKPFHLTAYKNVGTYDLSTNAAGAMRNSTSLQVLDGSANARVLLKSCMDKCVVAKIPVTDQVNVLGEAESDLEAGDLIQVRMDVPINNTVDIYCHSQSAKIAGIGEGQGPY
jgi:hypothetical protein